MNDEPFYDVVATEIQQGHLKPGLWTKAFADANGDQTKARVIYIRQRVVQLQNEAAMATRNRQESERRAKKEQQASEQVAEWKRNAEEFDQRYANVKPLNVPAWFFPIAIIFLILVSVWLFLSQ